MQLRIFLQRSEYNSDKDGFQINKTNIAIPSQYSVYFTGSDDELVYIMVSIKIRVGKDIDSGNSYWYVLDYNTGTWWICEDETITNFGGYPENVYDELSHENEKIQGKYR